MLTKNSVLFLVLVKTIFSSLMSHKVVENGKVAQNILDDVHITLNKNSIPFEKLSPFKTSGIRIGTAAVTARGFGPEECRKVAELIVKTLKIPKMKQC